MDNIKIKSYLKNLDYDNLKNIQKSAMELIGLLNKYELKIKYESDDVDKQLVHHIVIKDIKDEIIFENTWTD